MSDNKETVVKLVEDLRKRAMIYEISIDPSETDAKRMMDAFLIYELSGASNESII